MNRKVLFGLKIMAFLFTCFIWATEMMCVFFEEGSEIIDCLEGCYLLGGSVSLSIMYCGKNCSLVIQSLHIIRSENFSKRTCSLGFAH